MSIVCVKPLRTLQQIKYKLIIIVTMLECKTVTLRTRPFEKRDAFLLIWIIIRAIVTRKQ